MVLSRLKPREAELRKMGIISLSIFGSTARGEQRTDSDIDLAVRFDPSAGIGLFSYNGIANHIEKVLGGKVDLISEPARTDRMQAQIDRDRIRVF